MVRILAVGVACVLLAPSGWADPAQDCNQDKDVGRKIRGCTEFIQQTRDARPRADGHYNRGNAYSAKNDYARAIADYSKAIEINPRHAHAYNNRGRVHWQMKDYDRAIADQTKAVEVAKAVSVKANAYYNLGVVYRDKNEHDRAIAEYSKAIALKAKEAEVNVRAYLNRAAAYMIKAHYDGAIADLSKAIEISPKRALSYYAAGGVNSIRSDLYNERAWAYFKAGQAAKGLLDAEMSLALRPNDARTLDTRGHISEVLGRRDEAIADFRRALSLAPDDPEVQASAKEALQRLGAGPSD